MAESPDGETPVIVGMADAAMHMYDAAIEALPDTGHPEYPERAGLVLAGLRKLQKSLAEAASRSRATPAVIVALSGVRSRYDRLIGEAATGPYAELGQRLYVARQRARLSPSEAANAVGLGADLIESVEAGETATSSEEAKIADLLAGLEGRPIETPRVPQAAAVAAAPVVDEPLVDETPSVSDDAEPGEVDTESVEPESADSDVEPAEVNA